MTEKDKKDIIEIIEKTIETKVNGKIDRLQKGFDDHKEEMEPIMDLIKGSVVAKKVIIWFTSLILAIGTTVIMIKTVLK